MTGRRVGSVDQADAWQRALRTLWQGFGLDAAVAIGGGLILLLDGGDVTSSLFWGAVGVLVLKSLLMSLSAYLQRLRKAPKPMPDPPLPEPNPLQTID